MDSLQTAEEIIKELMMVLKACINDGFLAGDVLEQACEAVDNADYFLNHEVE